ncbi:UNVERIFIED_ORG: hypothetical protein [Escherichia phage CMSTMSU]
MKINEQSMRITSARAAGMSDMIVGNMQTVLNQCYAELEIRQGQKEKPPMMNKTHVYLT